ncbi:(2,3-dihydroxybenzoyl)adenylate synthase [Serratia plymuthica]|uniref:(2,3-dihydroxybenzoyl)adenylate synthase n=1 Tax=Serratia plymuthica TaxID=82996 RepID=UPI0018D69D69|nr:(2,3-dihydroxybenzoyl)adenylate synthase [Serratia plymuthica]QPS57305.1 (2,3-dihydroxybenzoyl)adenylate synthase [Serratia plymuthica]CAI1795498.1 2,3-dihydroxybenzoate-AMP ligase [Serratia plymuthica]
MSIDFTPWPEALARRYRERGYWTDRPLTDIIARQAKNDAVALIDPQRSLSYRRLNQLSDRLAAALQRRGLHSGDTALVQLGNVVEFYVAFFALLKIGVVPVNALFSHQRNELKAYAAQIKPALLIADRQHGLFGNDEFLTAFRAENPSLRVVGLRSQAEGEQSLAAWLEEDAEDFIATPTPADQVAFFQLSGGSTGTPKLIPRTHNDYYYSIRRSVEICHFDAHTRYLCALPVAHNYPMSSPGVLGVFYGAGLVVFASDPDAGQCFRLIEQHQINVTALVPPAVTLWLQAIEEWGGQPLASLKLLQVGGAKLSETLAARIPAEIGCQLQQVFGMAEGLVNYTRLDDDDRHILTTQGCPMSPDDELWVADDEGNPLPVGQTGRLMTRGPYTFRGYYQSPEHNAAAFDKDGFYCSGDLISLTEEGYVKVEGRQKDQINRGGEKIAAEEIENLLLRHPEVINAALVSMPDELMGEKSCAFIIAASALKPVVLRRHLRAEGVAEFKLPDRFIQVDTLPLTPVGKVDKKRLRQRLETQSLTQAQGE